MMNNALAAAQNTPVNTFAQYLAARRKQIASVLPKHLTPERICRVALTAYTKTPGLANCDMSSVFQAVMQASELGLEPGGAMNHCYLIPYGNQCQFIVSYRGLIELAMRSGEIESIEANCVFENDEFEECYGMKRNLFHRPNRKGPRGEFVLVYAVAYYKSGSVKYAVMDKEEIESIRKRSRASRNGPWVTDYFEMAKKTAIRRLCKSLTMMPEKLAQAIEADDRSEDAMEAAFQMSTAAQVATVPRTPVPSADPAPAAPVAEALSGQASAQALPAPESDGAVPSVASPDWTDGIPGPAEVPFAQPPKASRSSGLADKLKVKSQQGKLV